MRSLSARWFVKVESYSCIEVRTSGRTQTCGICPVDSSRLASQNWTLSRGNCTRNSACRQRRVRRLICVGWPQDLQKEPALLSAWLLRDWQGTPANDAPEEHDDIGWFDLEELPPPAHVLVRTALVDAIRSHRGWTSRHCHRHVRAHRGM